MKMWNMLVAGLALASTLAVSPALADVPAKGGPSELRPLPANPVWNAPAGGLSWEKLRGKVVIVDFWNWH